jgi:2-dehydro-3-deoxygalactonokinase
MRGEETQLLGLMALGEVGERLVCMPGTHSKWVELAEGRIAAFRTYMTGEVFGLLCAHSILGRLMAPAGSEEEDAEAFALGLEHAHRARGAGPGALLNLLFAARTLGLFGTVPAGGLRSFLSGLLLGAEIDSELARAARSPAVTLVAARRLAEHYARALAARGIPVEIAPEDVAATGLWTIATAAGLLR